MKNIFISSTFIDMQAERDLVQERVLPALREEARKYGENVGVIDLRWGVDTSTLETEEGAMKVLQVCLDEIDRSHPYMLIFLGERYGTVMREDLIEDSVCGREDKYITEDYMKSITALEVEYGALSEKYGELNHCVVCFREPVVHMLDGAEKDLYAEHTEEGKRKLEALKERIKRDLGEDDRLITYSCTWDKSARQLVDFRTGGRPLEDVLIEHIRALFCEEWEYYGNLSWFEKDRLQVKAQQESALLRFVGRETLVADYSENMRNGNHVILEGESGSGKTSLLYKTEERLRDEGKTLIVLCGTSENNKDYYGLIRILCYFLETVAKKAVHKETQLLELGELEEYYVSLSTEITERVFIFIDAVERLGSQDIGLVVGQSDKIICFLTTKGKTNTISYVRTKKSKDNRKNINSRRYAIESKEGKSKTYMVWPLRKFEAKELICQGLEVQHRDAYEDIVSSIMKKFNVINPLYISIVLERLKYIGGELLSNANDEKAIIEICKKCISEIPDDICEASNFVMSIIIKKISEECFNVMEYIMAARNGLRKEDLLGIFSSNKQLDVLLVTRLLNLMDAFLYEDGNGLLRCKHDVFKEAILVEDKRKKEIRKEISRYIRTLGSTDYLKLTQGIYYAYEVEDVELLKELILEGNENSSLVDVVKRLTKEHGIDLIIRFIEEQLHLIGEDERKVVQDFFVTLFGGCSFRSIVFGLNRQRNVRVCSKLLTKYHAIEGEEIFELYCLAEICRGVLVGNCLVKPLRNYVRLLFGEIAQEKKEADEYKYVAEFFKRWKRQSFLPYRLVLLTKESVKYYVSSIKEWFMCAKEKKNSTRMICYRKKSPLKAFKLEVKNRNRILQTMRCPEMAELCLLLGRKDLSEILLPEAEEEQEQDNVSAVEKILRKMNVVDCDEFIGNRRNNVKIHHNYEYMGKKYYSYQLQETCKKYYDLAKFQAEQGLYDELQWTFERVCRYYDETNQDFEKKCAMVHRYGFGIGYKPCDISQLHATCALFDTMLEYLEGVSITEKAEEFDLLGRLANKMAEDLNSSNWNEYAFVYYEKSIKYCEMLCEIDCGKSSLGMLANSHESAGDAFRELGDFKTARIHYEKGMACVKEAGKGTDRNLALVHYFIKMVNLLTLMNLFSEVLVYYEKVLEELECNTQEVLISGDDEVRYYIRATREMYLCYMKQKNLTEADKYLCLAKEQAEKIYERTGLEKDRVLLEEVLSIKG